MIVSFNKITKNKSIDTGMALVLICLLLANVFFNIHVLNLWAIGILIVVMSIPSILKPFAFIWFNFSHFLGNIVSKILLSSIFFIIVVPMGLIIKTFRNGNKFQMLI